MFIAVQEINTAERTYQPGDVIENPTARMLELGAVRHTPTDAPTDEPTDAPTDAPTEVNAQVNAEPDHVKPVVKQSRAKREEKPTKVSTVDLVDRADAELLTEDSASVDVIKSDE